MQEERTIAEVRRLSHAALAAPELLQRVVHALYRVVPFEFYSAATIDPASSLITHAFSETMGRGSGGSARRPVNPAWFEHFYFEEGYTRTLSLMQRGQWASTIFDETEGRPERSLVYRESHRPAGIGHNAQVVFVDRHLWGDLDLYRAMGSPPFSERELALLRRIAPDVAAGLKAAALRAQSSSDDLGDATPGVVMVDPLGRISATATARSLLAELGDDRASWSQGDDLPVAVQVVLGVLRRTLSPAANNDGDVIPQLQVRGHSGRWLSLHASGAEGSEGRAGDRIVVIAPARPQEVVWLGMSAYGLTPREEEVVRLVVGGLSTRQISDRLFIAEHTVQRHLSNIFEKVGVRGRRALVKQFFFEQVLPGVN